MGGGMVWITIIGGILLVSLLVSFVGSIRRTRSHQTPDDAPSLALAAAAFGKLRYAGGNDHSAALTPPHLQRFLKTAR